MTMEELTNDELLDEFEKAAAEDDEHYMYEIREEILSRMIDDEIKPKCADCGKDEPNPGLDVCGTCYHKRIWGRAEG